MNTPRRKIEQASGCRRMKAATKTARTSALTPAGPNQRSFSRKEAAPVHATHARPVTNTPHAVTTAGGGR